LYPRFVGEPGPSKRSRPTYSDPELEIVSNVDDDDENLDLAYRSDESEYEDVYKDPTEKRTTQRRKTKTAPTTSGLKLKLKMPEQYTNDKASHASVSIPGLTPDLVSSFFPGTDFRFLPLKADASSRPLYISPVNHTIILEDFHPLAAQAQDFLIAISEPVSRPAHIHEYKLTKHSLQAAISVGLETEDIVEVLNRLSKLPVAKEVVDFIRDSTKSYGKVKLVLKSNKYFVEVSDDSALTELLRSDKIKDSRVAYGDEVEQSLAPRKGDLVLPGTSTSVPAAAGENGAGVDASQEDIFVNVNLDKSQLLIWLAFFTKSDRPALDDELEDDDDRVHSFEIKESAIEVVKKECVDIDYPMLEEYDFRNDHVNADLEIDLKPTTTIRPYQEKSLSKMFGNGYAVSFLRISEAKLKLNDDTSDERGQVSSSYPVAQERRWSELPLRAPSKSRA
jgi:DNA excision repair protein ERCC-3